MNEFDAITYLKTVLPKNKLIQEKEFSITTAPSMANMAQMVYENRDYDNHIVIIDTATTTTSQGDGGGYWDNHQYTVVVLMRYDINDEADRVAKRNMCREIRRQIHSKMLLDADRYEQEDLQFFDTERVMSQEVTDFVLNGLTGLWFIFQLSTAADLRYKLTEWTN